MSAYEVIKASMEDKQPISCVYQGHERRICVHTLGAKNGALKVLAFQFAGGSSKGLPPGGEWRCMFIDQMQNVGADNGAWHTRNDHSRPQTCIDDVHFEVFA